MVFGLPGGLIKNDGRESYKWKVNYRAFGQGHIRRKFFKAQPAKAVLLTDFSHKKHLNRIEVVLTNTTDYELSVATPVWFSSVLSGKCVYKVARPCRESN